MSDCFVERYEDVKVRFVATTPARQTTVNRDRLPVL